MFQTIFATLIALTAPRDEEKGATAVEYALLVAGIAIVLLVGTAAFGQELQAFFTGLGDQVGINGTGS